MKHAGDVQPEGPVQERLRGFDLREIDAADQRSHFALKYVGRLEAMREVIRRAVPPGGTVLEVGCAQANLSLLLAEEGFRTVALDLIPEALAYAKKKHERGEFWPVCGSADHPPFRGTWCDALVVGELLEHCAHPDAVLRALARCVRDEGVLVITTPNGRRLRSPDRTYSQVATSEAEARQFGAGGEDHPFVFTLPELREVVRRAGFEVTRVRWVASMLHTDRLGPIKRLFSPGCIRAVARVLGRAPLLGPLTALTLLVVARRSR